MAQVSGILLLVVILCLSAIEISGKSFKCPSGWKSRDTSGTVECYLYGDKSFKKYSQARDFCKDKRGQLVSILSDSENEWIKSNRPIGISSYWTGYIQEDGKDFWNDKRHAVGGYTRFEGISTCISKCNSAVVDNWGKWSKVNGDDYIHGANALCKMTENDHSSAWVNVPMWTLVLAGIAIAQLQLLKSSVFVSH